MHFTWQVIMALPREMSTVKNMPSGHIKATKGSGHVKYIATPFFLPFHTTESAAFAIFWPNRGTVTINILDLEEIKTLKSAALADIRGNHMNAFEFWVVLLSIFNLVTVVLLGQYFYG